MNEKPQSEMKADAPRMLAVAFGVFCLLVLAAKLVSESTLPSPVAQPEQVPPDLQKLQNLFISGQIVEAKEGLIEYTANHPDDALAHSLLGHSYSLVGSHGLAIDTLKIAVALQPENTRYRALLAAVYKAIGWAELEAEQYSHILVHEPSNIEALAARMEINYNLGNHSLALEDADYAVRVHPNSPFAHLLYARLKMLSGALDEAMDSLEFVEANGSDKQRDAVRQWRQQIAEQAKTQGQ